MIDRTDYLGTCKAIAGAKNQLDTKCLQDICALSRICQDIAAHEDISVSIKSQTIRTRLVDSVVAYVFGIDDLKRLERAAETSKLDAFEGLDAFDDLGPSDYSLLVDCPMSPEDSEAMQQLAALRLTDRSSRDDAPHPRPADFCLVTRRLATVKRELLRICTCLDNVGGNTQLLCELETRICPLLRVGSRAAVASVQQPIADQSPADALFLAVYRLLTWMHSVLTRNRLLSLLADSETLAHCGLSREALFSTIQHEVLNASHLQLKAFLAAHVLSPGEFPGRAQDTREASLLWGDGPPCERQVCPPTYSRHSFAFPVCRAAPSSTRSTPPSNLSTFCLNKPPSTLRDAPLRLMQQKSIHDAEHKFDGAVTKDGRSSEIRPQHNLKKITPVVPPDIFYLEVLNHPISDYIANVSSANSFV
jgi:hypothetical protein